MTAFKDCKMHITNPNTEESTDIEAQLPEDQIFSMLDASTRSLHILAKGKDRDLTIEITDISKIYIEDDPPSQKGPKTMAFFF